MKEIIKQIREKLFCKHEWIVHSTNAIYRNSGDTFPRKRTRILLCRKCGKIKKITL